MGFAEGEFLWNPFCFMQDEEIWLPIPGFNGKYLCSSHGRIQSIYRESKCGKKTPTGTFLKFTTTSRGYYHIRLSKWENGGRINKTCKVHRLICMAFHENPKNKPQVNHKDLNQLNNRADNLEWATAKENTNHAQLNGRMPIAKYVPPVGEHPKRLKKVIHRQSGEVLASVYEVAERLKIKPKEVRRKLSGERYNNLPYEYLAGEYTYIYKNIQR